MHVHVVVFDVHTHLPIYILPELHFVGLLYIIEEIIAVDGRLDM